MEYMAKKGMRRYDAEPPQGTNSDKPKQPAPPRNEVSPVPELQGNAKRTKDKSRPIFYD